MSSSSRPIGILLAEDNAGDARLVQETLHAGASVPFQLSRVGRISELTEALAVGTYDILLLDLGLPDAGCPTMAGLQALQALAPSLPIVILSGLDDDTFALSAVQRGIQDYLVKGHYTDKQLWASIRYAIERKGAELRLAHKALYDSVTSLASARLFWDRLEQAAMRVERGTLDGFSLIEIDIDNFTMFNAMRGNLAGDSLLKLVAERLERSVRRNDAIGRLGDGTFAVIAEGHEERITQRIISAVNAPVILQHREIECRWRIGLARCPEDGRTAAQLMEHAGKDTYKGECPTLSLIRREDGPSTASEAQLAA